MTDIVVERRACLAEEERHPLPPLGHVLDRLPKSRIGLDELRPDLPFHPGEEDFLYVVSYDPEGGFVTGGGWINSPAGAYAADPALTGKATFGFVSKYQKGASVPTGATEFQFQVANLNFKSSSYDWLVVAGAAAKYKGTGMINGAGSYGFMLNAIDGQVMGGGGADKFRIKIWDKATGASVYDNQLGVGDDAQPTTVIGGGSIVVHKL